LTCSAGFGGKGSKGRARVIVERAKRKHALRAVVLFIKFNEV